MTRLFAPAGGLQKALLTATLLALFHLFLSAQPALGYARGLQPPSVIKIPHLAISVPLQTALKTKKYAIDSESPAVRTLALKQAAEYIAYRRTQSKLSQALKWLNECEAAGKDTPNPYCSFERSRLAALESPKQFNSGDRPARKEVVEYVKNGKYDKLANTSEHEFQLALNAIGEPEALVPLARTMTSSIDCVPPALATALGGKLEELFPNTDDIELTKALYHKAATCGANPAAGKAAFRLGLILIWQGKCSDVPGLMTKSELISDSTSIQARAKYWRYKCALQDGNEESQKAEREALAHDYPFSFQNLAVNGEDTERMNKIINTEDPEVAQRSIVRPDLNESLRAAEALAESGSPHLAAEILDHQVNEMSGMEPAVRLYTAVFLNRNDYALPRFKILSSLFQDSPRSISMTTLKMLFPLGFFQLVNNKKVPVDPLLILSLIRQESAFNTQARSGVGARGLMQVMPATAKMIGAVRSRQLLIPSVNVKIGTKYFAQRLREYSGDVELTLAAYNAGANRVESWVKRYPTDNKILFLDLMPFKETRDYVSSILRNYYWYTRIYGVEEKAPEKVAGNHKNKRVAKNKTAVWANRAPSSIEHSIINANAGGVSARLLTGPQSELVGPPERH